jgi:hypothetical protein
MVEYIDELVPFMAEHCLLECGADCRYFPDRFLKHDLIPGKRDYSEKLESQKLKRL